MFCMFSTQVRPGAGSSIHRDAPTSHPTHCLLCFNGVVTLAWFSQRPQCDAHGNTRVREASQVVRANQGVAFPDEFAAHCFHGARDVAELPAADRPQPARPGGGGPAAVAQSAGVHDPAHAVAVAEGRSRGGQAAVARSAGVHDAEGSSRGGQAAVAQSAGIHNPAHAVAVAEWGSRGGQAAVAQSAGVHNPAHAPMLAEWGSLGGQAGGLASGVKRADMASVRFLQAEQEARGGPVVGSRKRTSTQRMNL
jgi:hypothetical protein